MKYKLVVFDIAGTTVSDKGNINRAFRDSFDYFGIHVKEEEINQVMGYRKTEAVNMVLDKYVVEMDSEEKKAMAADIHENFELSMISYYHHTSDLQPLPYAEDVFKKLRQEQVKVCLDTGFSRAITQTILKRLGWADHNMIDCVVCSDEVLHARPAPDMIYKIMQQCNVDDVKEVLKVGDTAVDIKEGRNAGCGLVVAVSTGAYTREELLEYSPDYVIDSLKELLPIIS